MFFSKFEKLRQGRFEMQLIYCEKLIKNIMSLQGFGQRPGLTFTDRTNELQMFTGAVSFSVS